MERSKAAKKLLEGPAKSAPALFQENWDKLTPAQRRNMGPGSQANAQKGFLKYKHLDARAIADRQEQERIPEGNVRRGGRR